MIDMEEAERAVSELEGLLRSGVPLADAEKTVSEKYDFSRATLLRRRVALRGSSDEARRPYDEERRVAAKRLFDECRAQGLSVGEATARVTEELGVSSATLGRIRRAARTDATTVHGNRKLLDVHVDALVEWVEADATTTVYELTRKLQREFDITVVEATVQKALHARGKKKRHLAKAQRQAAGIPDVRVGYNERHRPKAPSHPHRDGYPSDITDDEWELMEPLMSEAGAGNPTVYLLRDIVDAIRYQNRTGCQWRYLPNDLPNWHTVLRYQQKWIRSGLWDTVQADLVRMAREREGRAPEPTVAVIDAQTVQSDQVSDEVGFDGHKKKKGRKRTLVTDTLGFVLAVFICAANIHDAKAALNVINPDFSNQFTTVHTVSGDLGYVGLQRATDANPEVDLDIDIVRRPTGGQGGVWTGPEDHDVISPATPDRPFPILRRRWVIERTNGWNMRYRRLRLDYERSVETSRARILMVSSQRLLRRLTVDP